MNYFKTIQLNSIAFNYFFDNEENKKWIGIWIGMWKGKDQLEKFTYCLAIGKDHSCPFSFLPQKTVEYRLTKKKKKLIKSTNYGICGCWFSTTSLAHASL